jgi:hypothetical protein
MRSNASRWIAPISGCFAKFCSQKCSQILGRRRAGDGTEPRQSVPGMTEKSNPKPLDANEMRCGRFPLTELAACLLRLTVA